MALQIMNQDWDSSSLWMLFMFMVAKWFVECVSI